MPEQEQPAAQPTDQPNPQSTSPSVSPETAPAGPAAQAGDNPGQVLAIIGLVLAFLPLQLVGLILSIIAKIKARKGTSANTISLIGIILNAVLGVIGAVVTVTLLLVALSGIQNHATADSFLTAVQTKDFDKALSYTDSPSNADYRSFLESAAPALGTSHKEVDSAYNSDRTQEGIVYTLSGGTKNYARVTVKKENGGPKVIGLVYSTSKLGAAPVEDSMSSEGASAATGKLGETDDGSVNSELATQCITKNDTASLPGALSDIGSGSVVDVQWVTYFNPNTTDYSYANIVPDELDQLASFIKKQSGKSFTAEILGSVAEDRTTSGAHALASSRAAKLQQELVSRGVDASVLTVVSPSTSNHDGNLSGSELYRTAEIHVKSC